MNAPTATLLLATALATGFAALGAVIYLILRRWSPAAGAQAAVSSLSVMTLVWVLACLPLPGWAPIVELRQVPAASVEAVANSRPSTSTTAPSPANGNEIHGDSIAPTSSAVNSGAATKAMLATLSRDLIEAAGRLSEVPSSSDSSTSIGGITRLSALRIGLTIAMVGGVLFGLVRLATGLWSMRGLLGRSLPVDDAGLHDQLAMLRAEMGCVRPVTVRRSPELTTPATVGVRRPVILLPEEWATWDESERRAVLAHELAHVCRGDFVAGLLAQASLALQFYHPLAHWLLSRHRLDQELAADAWSAQLAGGNLPYLTVLARMALRQDDRPVSWPARAFLPRRGTLLRRIEMLRSRRPARHATLSMPLRLGTPVALAILGVTIAGFRPPSQAGQPPSQAGGTIERPNGGLAPEDSKRGKVNAVSAWQPFDLSYVPAETRILLAVQPGCLLGQPGMAQLSDSLTRLGQSPGGPPVALEAIEQILVFWDGSSQFPLSSNSTGFPGPSGATVRFAGAGTAREFVGWRIPGAKPLRHAGQEYLAEPTAEGMAAFLPNDRTVVLARRDLLLSLIDDRDLPAPRQNWDESWKQVEDVPIALVADARWIRREYRRLTRQEQGRVLDPRVEMFAPLIEKVTSYGLGVDLGKELRLHLVAQAARAEDVKSVSETLQAALTLGRNAASSSRQLSGARSGRLAEFLDWSEAMAATLLERAALETKGPEIHLRAAAPVDGEKVGRLAGGFVVSAQEDATRYRSANNLKQIGLAFHNFEAANGYFPAQVMYGGKSGKVPYSWRVALLPYLNAQSLFQAYDFDEPWDGPNNRKLLDKMPAVYAYPELSGPSRTTPAYFVFKGKDAVLDHERPAISEITDGTSNTLLVVEAKRDVPWTRPEDIEFDAAVDPPKLGGFVTDGFNALFADGSTRFIKQGIAPHILKSLITRNGGEVIDSSSY